MNDDDLRDQLRRADPAASLPPLPGAEISALLGRATTAPTRRSVWKPAAASILLAAAAAGVFVGLRGSDPVVVRVGAGPEMMAKCAPPTAEGLLEAELVVEATVQKIEDGVVTLAVSRTFAGSEVDRVEVAQTDGASEVMLGGTGFESGAGYLVAIEDGVVKGCGYSGLASPELRGLYEETF
ncbi:hypothetical protein [Kineosporia babensis]|uniref:Uncharacterized protein n=1 Tax=Kineosporia babensis TaxID=499548 RepID=A0A9X1SST6_9ACTN|nr:hypothetical protein [Kineosporia babensis]MCD5310661.1 hypothetical protein [Kineosporia babensis]